MSLWIAIFLIFAAFLLGSAAGAEAAKTEDKEDDNPNGWGP